MIAVPAKHENDINVHSSDPSIRQRAEQYVTQRLTALKAFVEKACLSLRTSPELAAEAQQKLQALQTAIDDAAPKLQYTDLAVSEEDITVDCLTEDPAARTAALELEDTIARIRGRKSGSGTSLRDLLGATC